MSYFNNPTDLDELDKQCKQALIKNNYKTNEAARMAIMKEYQALKRRMTINDFSSGVNEVVEEHRAKVRAEEERVANLKNARYTDQDILALVSECKKYINAILRRCAESNIDYYVSWHGKVFNYDSENVCRMFNRLHNTMFSEELGQRYDAKREVLEYALKSRANTAKAKEQAMVKMEQLLGDYIKKVYSEYEDEYADVFAVAKEMSIKDKEKRTNGFLDKYLTIGSYIALVGIPIYMMVSMHSTDGLLLGLFMGVLAFIGIRLYRGFVRFMHKNFDGKNLSDSGFSRKRSRISEQDEYKKGKLGKILLNIFFS